MCFSWKKQWGRTASGALRRRMLFYAENFHTGGERSHADRHQNPFGHRAHPQIALSVLHSHHTDPSGQLSVQHCRPDFCRPGSGNHRHGRHQRGLPTDHRNHRRCPDAGRRLRGQPQPVPGPEGAGGSRQGHQPYGHPAAGGRGAAGGAGQPVCPAHCAALRSH